MSEVVYWSLTPTGTLWNVPRVWWSVLRAVAETEVDGALTAVSKRVLRSAAVV